MTEETVNSVPLSCPPQFSIQKMFCLVQDPGADPGDGEDFDQQKKDICR